MPEMEINMLKTPCIHPEILKNLAACGHGDKVLIADGNYPLDSNTGSDTCRIYLNLTQGMPLVTDVLKVFNGMLAIEKAEVMVPDTAEEPSIFSEFREILGKETELGKLTRSEFYEECRKDNIKLAVATGEQRIYANILLTVGATGK